MKKGDKGERVKRVQQGLIQQGIDVSGGADGDFGKNTETAVKEWQEGKYVTGVLSSKDVEEIIEGNEGLDGFIGDLSFIHKLEGHAGKPYWPGGQSGVTVDPGFDLGHNKFETLERLFREIFSEEELELLRVCMGIYGSPARDLLKSSHRLKEISVTEEEALKVMPEISKKYWIGITTRFPRLLAEDCPGSVQTAMLSLAYNRGHKNKGLNVLSGPVADGDWEKVADTIGNMQQNHQLPGIRKRRRKEAELIRSEIS